MLFAQSIAQSCAMVFHWFASHTQTACLLSDLPASVSDGPALLVNVSVLMGHRTEILCRFVSSGRSGNLLLPDGALSFSFATVVPPWMHPDLAHLATLEAGADACFAALYPQAAALGYMEIRTAPAGISCRLARNAPYLSGIYTRRLLGLTPKIAHVPSIRSIRPHRVVTGSEAGLHAATTFTAVRRAKDRTRCPRLPAIAADTLLTFQSSSTLLRESTRGSRWQRIGQSSPT